MSMPRKIRCEIESITDHGGHVYTVDLKPEMNVPSFRPGQFLHLTVDDYDPSGFWPESRVFSIASSPYDRSHIRICYAVKGRYTTKMEHSLKVGGKIWIKLPYGDFVIDTTSDAVLLAGGTGISAFTAFLEGLHPYHPHGVFLVYGARTPELLLFRDLILERRHRVPALQVMFFTELGVAGGADCFSGPISLDVVWPRLQVPLEKVFYLSGPPVMLSSLTAQLQVHGMPTAQIRTDLWE